MTKEDPVRKANREVAAWIFQTKGRETKALAIYQGKGKDQAEDKSKAPDYTGPMTLAQQFRAMAHLRDDTPAGENRYPVKQVRIGPQYQAVIPEFVGTGIISAEDKGTKQR